MRNPNERVTVVTTAYNAERYISRAIDSALNQSFGPVRVIIVDDGSSDRTSQIAASYGNTVELIRLETSQGPAVGRTVGLMNCKTEFVAFLDSDDYWMPRFAEETLSFLCDHPEAIAVCTGFSAVVWDGRKFHAPALTQADTKYYGVGGAMCPNFYRFWSEYMGVRTGTVMMRTEAVLATGGQRGDLRLTEDLEFWAYLATFGPWGFIPKPLFVTDQLAITPRERLSKLKNRYMLFRDMGIDDWAKRVRSRLTKKEDINAFESILTRIAGTITLANAYTLHFTRSYRLARRYGSTFGPGLGTALRVGVRGGPLLWPAVCVALRVREIAKAYGRLPFGAGFLRAKSQQGSGWAAGTCTATDEAMLAPITEDKSQDQS